MELVCYRLQYIRDQCFQALSSEDPVKVSWSCDQAWPPTPLAIKHYELYCQEIIRQQWSGCLMTEHVEVRFQDPIQKVDQLVREHAELWLLEGPKLKPPYSHFVGLSWWALLPDTLLISVLLKQELSLVSNRNIHFCHSHQTHNGQRCKRWNILTLIVNI